MRVVSTVSKVFATKVCVIDRIIVVLHPKLGKLLQASY